MRVQLSKRPNPYTWHQWYAWYPVNVNGVIVWLEYVGCKKFNSTYDSWWEYYIPGEKKDYQ